MVSRARAGRVRLGCLLIVLVVAALVYFGINIGGVYLDYYEYKDAMDTEARFAARNTDDEIREHLVAKADSLDLPEAAKKIQIRRKANQIWIWADYTQTVEFPGVARDIDFTPHAERVF